MGGTPLFYHLRVLHNSLENLKVQYLLCDPDQEKRKGSKFRQLIIQTTIDRK